MKIRLSENHKKTLAAGGKIPVEDYMYWYDATKKETAVSLKMLQELFEELAQRDPVIRRQREQGRTYFHGLDQFIRENAE